MAALRRPGVALFAAGSAPRIVEFFRLYDDYVQGCEDSNCILVLRWLGLGGRNLPILFQRTHVPDNLKWPARVE